MKALTGIDDHSRFCVCAGLMEHARSRAVCGHFVDAMREHGVPDEILTDNGKVFTGRHFSTPSEVLFDRICRQNGIIHRLTGVRSLRHLRRGVPRPQRETKRLEGIAIPLPRSCRETDRRHQGETEVSSMPTPESSELNETRPDRNRGALRPPANIRLPADEASFGKRQVK